MTAQVTNYSCPNCAGPLRFASESGQMACDYCAAKFDLAVIEQMDADRKQAEDSAGIEPQWDVSMAGGHWTEEEAARMRGYVCPSCGGEIICDATTAAASCPYCGNPAVVPGQFAGQLRPDAVIPFKLDKQTVIEALRKHYKGKRFLPKAFADANTIAEIKGIYVPFWLFDGQTDTVKRFHGTKVRKYRQGNDAVTETMHYRVVRGGVITFEKVPVDGSYKMPDAYMDSIEPFFYGDLKPFSPAYLSGFFADKYDQSAKYCSERAKKRIMASTEQVFRTTTRGYTTAVPEYSRTELKNGKARYVLLPVWTLVIQWKGRKFLFAMNGQTGKMIGDLPMDWSRFWRWFAALTALGMVILTPLMILGNLLNEV